MYFSFARHAPRVPFLKAAVSLSLVAGLLSCGPLQVSSTSTLSERIETRQYQMVPVARSWVYVPQGLLTLQRDLDNIVEQRIALPNDTTIAGDNYLLLRGRGGNPLSGGRLKLEDMLDQTGGVPAPFEGLSNRNMATATDELGPYFIAEKSVGVDTTCVLVVRSLKNAARPLPAGADSMDVLLRNCTRQGREAALAPIQAQYLAATPALAGGANVRLHNMSPFAAPGAERP
ncbi:hypothetical protein E2L08_14310 [Palleronia sediminis]|uniref:Lipoprotein n=1 Tax=Palleronia sediminis TaxID=2547833 RepID=A0A4R5ZYH4_9RHOB|nr:hypothetical protein [Palleronia sediminis]TDL76261.1 hypothetical protein E2L08_14310 [Palleronia sediminis]